MNHLLINLGNMFEDLDSSMHMKREKAKARLLRKSSWWQHKLAKPQCFYCRQSPRPEEITMDHILPLSRGGYSTKGNIALACKSCNTRKKHYSVMEWDEYLRGTETTAGSSPLAGSTIPTSLSNKRSP